MTHRWLIRRTAKVPRLACSIPARARNSVAAVVRTTTRRCSRRATTHHRSTSLANPHRSTTPPRSSPMRRRSSCRTSSRCHRSTRVPARQHLARHSRAAGSQTLRNRFRPRAQPVVLRPARVRSKPVSQVRRMHSPQLKKTRPHPGTLARMRARSRRTTSYRPRNRWFAGEHQSPARRRTTRRSRH